MSAATRAPEGLAAIASRLERDTRARRRRPGTAPAAEPRRASNARSVPFRDATKTNPAPEAAADPHAAVCGDPSRLVHAHASPAPAPSTRHPFTVPSAPHVTAPPSASATTPRAAPAWASPIFTTPGIFATPASTRSAPAAPSSSPSGSRIVSIAAAAAPASSPRALDVSASAPPRSRRPPRTYTPPSRVAHAHASNEGENATRVAGEDALEDNTLGASSAAVRVSPAYAADDSAPPPPDAAPLKRS